MPNKDDEFYDKRCVNFLLKNKLYHKIFSVMGKYSRSVFNSTIFCFNIFMRFKNLIFSEIYSKCSMGYVDKDKDKIIDYLYFLCDFYYKYFSKNYELYKKNNNIIYKFINYHFKNTPCLHNNLYTQRSIIKDLIVKHKLIHFNDDNKKLVFHDIVDNIINSRYKSNYFKTRHQLLHRKPLTITDPSFITHVKQKKFLLNIKEPNWKQKIFKEFGISSKSFANQNIISQFTRDHLQEDGKNLSVDGRVSIVNKTYGCISSYYESRKKGLKAKMPYYSDELYNVMFDKQSFKVIINEERIQLSLGKYISQNFSKIIDNRYIKISKTKYVLKHHLCKKIKGNNKNYIKVGNKYVEKNNPNIMDTRFIFLKLSNKLINRKLTKDQLELKWDICKLLTEKKKLPTNKVEIMKLINKLYQKFVNGTLKKNIDGIGMDDIDIHKKIKVIDIKPLYNGYKFKVNMTYRTLKNFTKISSNFLLKDSISIDLGMTNLMVIYDPTGIQRIVRGGPIKAINEYFNRKISNIQSKNAKKGIKKFTNRMHNLLIKRENQINNAFNILVNRLYNIYKNKKLVIIGYNEKWKQSINIGKKNNRMFYQIPYKKLLDKLRLKLEKNNIRLIEVNEHYTSKCDALTLERICKHKPYSGKRINRLFRSGNGKIIHSDLNGAMNMMRKIFKKLKTIKGEKIYNPTVIKIDYSCSKKQKLNSKKAKKVNSKKSKRLGKIKGGKLEPIVV